MGYYDISGNGIAIVYHEICYRSELHLTGRMMNPLRWFVEPDMFAHHIRLAKEREYEIISIDQICSDEKLEKFVFLTFDDGGLSNYTGCAPILDEFGINGHFFLVTDSIDTVGYLNSYMVKEMADNGHHIGSHSKSHRNLAFLPDNELQIELEHSKKSIEDLLGRPCVSLSIPSGLVSKRVLNSAYNVGYKNIFTSEPMLIVSINGSRSRLGRWSIEQHGPDLVRLLNKNPFYLGKMKLRYAVLNLLKTLFGSNYHVYRKISSKVNEIYGRRVR